MIRLLKNLGMNLLRVLRDRFALERIAASSEDCRIDPRAIIHVRANCAMRLGKRVSIGAFTVIWVWPDDVGGGYPAAALEIGDDTYIGELNNIRVSGTVKVGEKCQISQGVSIIGSNHSYTLGTPIIDQPWSREKVGVRIEDDVWIGANSVILPGVTVGRGSIIASGSVVTKSIPPNVVVAGVPARILKERR